MSEQLSESQLAEVREAAEEVVSPKSTSTLPRLIKRDSFYSNWRQAGSIFEGKYSSGTNTPLTPHTPLLPSDRQSKAVPAFLGGLDTSPKRDTVLSGLFENLITPPLSSQPSFEDRTSRFESDFKLVSSLGAGHFAEVFKCLNKIDGNYYAVKQIKFNSRKLRRTDAIQEAYALAASNLGEDNTHIVRYHSVWFETDCLYIVMELTECSLSKLLDKRPVTQALIIKVLQDIAKGLRKLHAHSIVHMDTKADNILYSYSKKFKLGDLGLARVTTNLTGEIPEGDARYLALEVLQSCAGRIPDLTKADIFALGATVYELMRGSVLPMNGPEWRALRQGQFEISGDFEDSLKTLVKQMMNPDPAMRPSAQEVLEHELISTESEELRKWKNYARQLETELAELKGLSGYKRQKRLST